MATIKKGDVLIPELLLEHIKGAFSGMTVMGGTGAATVSTSMPAGKSAVGDQIKVPYFGTIGELEDLAADGDALTPKGISDSNELATVRHSGIAIEATKWAQWSAAADPYAEGARQMLEAVRRRADKALIDIAMADSNAFVNDVWSAGSPVNLTYDVMANSIGKFGDEAEDFAGLVVHSATFISLLKLKDLNGLPLLTQPADGSLPRFLGKQLFVSDRLTKDVTDPSHPKYTSLLLKKGALAFWANGSPTIATDRDILADTDVAALHIYWAAHSYKRLATGSKSGVCRIVHNAE